MFSEISITGVTPGTSDLSKATEGVDFLKNGTHQVVFERNFVVAEFTIPIISDQDVENDEEFYVDIVHPEEAINSGRSRTTVIILNDDGLLHNMTLANTVREYRNDDGLLHNMTQEHCRIRMHKPACKYCQRI